MSMELGLLLGRYDNTQSFEFGTSGSPIYNSLVFYTSSWTIYTGTSGYIQNTLVHSSNFGAKVECYSQGASVGGIGQDYNQANDFGARAWSEVNTHRLVSYFWATADTAAHSGYFFAQLGGVNQVIGYGSQLVMHRVEALNIRSYSSPSPSIDFTSSTNSMAPGNYFYLDDLLTGCDVIDLNPSWDFKESRLLNIVEHQTLGGRNAAYPWAHRGTWEIPLQYVSTSHANLMNYWWRQSQNLMFNADTSDTSLLFVVRMTNAEMPFQKLQSPYQQLYQGTLKLEAVTNGLAF